MFIVQPMRKERVSVYVTKKVVPVESTKKKKAVEEVLSVLMIHFA